MPITSQTLFKNKDIGSERIKNKYNFFFEILMNDYQSACKKLVLECANLVKNYDFSQPLLQQIRRTTIVPNINLIEFNFKQGHPQKVGIRTIYSHKNLRLSVYHLPKNLTMKMHDHPQMQVMTYILAGNMQTRTLTPKRKNLYQENIKSVRANDIMTIDGIQENLHEFVGGDDGCTFLDILFPDYDDEQREFRMYETVKHHSGFFKLKEIPPVDMEFVDI